MLPVDNPRTNSYILFDPRTNSALSNYTMYIKNILKYIFKMEKMYDIKVFEKNLK